MSFETIECTTDGAVALIRFNRPRVFNAISEQCIREVYAALDQLRTAAAVRAVVFTGSDRFFCAGADISELDLIHDVAGAMGFSRKYQGLFQAVESFRKPTIAAVSGFALGGGCELALSCDLRVLSEGAELGLPEIDIGAFPAGGGTQKLQRLIGMGRAKEILYTGRRIGAQEALALGLANRVVPAGQAVTAAVELANEVARKSPTAIAALKRAVNIGANLDYVSALAFETEAFGVLSSHANFREGVRAFLEKRTAKYEDDV